MTRIAALLLGLAAMPLAAQEAPPVVVTPLASPSVAADGDPILLPQGPAQAVVAEFAIAPGAALPVHSHPHPRLAWVLEGSLVVTVADTGEESTYREGDVVVEMVDEWHWGRNAGEGPLRLLVIDLVPEGESNTILRED